MNIEVERHDRLPRLAWVLSLEHRRLKAWVGRAVEVGEGWLAEAVWAGDFSSGGFDRTAVVFGSGVRLRADHARIVNSAGLTDRIWLHRSGGATHASNSLPALLAATRDRLRGEIDYDPFHRNLPTDDGRPAPFLPTRGGEVGVVYHGNVVWDGEQLTVVSKPASADEFSGFGDYCNFLYEAVEAIAENATSEKRQQPGRLLTTISRGYDSAAVSVLARDAGCRRAVTMKQARSVLPRDDSGKELATKLGLHCRVVDRGERGGPAELVFLAADGRADDENLAAFEFPGTVTVLFSGGFGGVIWEDREDRHPALAEYADANLLSFCEYRLSEGVIHCPVPYLGYDRAEDILRIMRSSAMDEWSVGGQYDRPIPRRILEEAGIPRGMFGQRKNAVQFEDSFYWPSREDLQREYSEHLRDAGRDVPPVGLYRALNALDRVALLPIEERSPASFQGLRDTLRRPGRRLFAWANNTLADRLSSEFGDNAHHRVART